MLSMRVHGLDDLQRDLKALGPAVDRDVPQDMARVARPIATRAASLAPKRSGSLASSVRVAMRKGKPAIVSQLPYANVQHWGGTIAPHGGRISIVGRHFVTRAVEERKDDLADAVGDTVDNAARRHGWH